MGGIGTGADQHSNRRLVGDAPRLPVRAIPKWGTVTLTWPQNLAHALSTRVTRTAADRLVISTAGVEVEVVLREWPMPTVRWRQRGIRTAPAYATRCTGFLRVDGAAAGRTV